MSKPKDYKFQHQKRRFRLRVYPMGMSVKIFMEGHLRDISVQNVSSKPLLEYFFYDERNQEHKVTVERAQQWFKINHIVYFDGQAIYKTAEHEPSQ